MQMAKKQAALNYIFFFKTQKEKKVFTTFLLAELLVRAPLLLLQPERKELIINCRAKNVCSLTRLKYMRIYEIP